MKYWRQAASLIVAANRTRNVANIPQTVYGSTENPSNPGNQQGQKTNANDKGIVRIPLKNDVDYSVLLLQRAQSSTFFAGAEVFPGGAVDDADFSLDWVELFKEAGINSIVDFGKMLTIQGERPLVFTEKRETSSPSTIPSELAFRICAIRETFEEAGVLMLKSFQDVQNNQCTEVTFAKNYQHPSLSESKIDEWRHRVHEDAHQFILLCRSLQCIPDVWSLMEWSDWLTPSTNKKRYDTMFFMCCMKDVPEVKHDAKETVQVKVSLKIFL
ncbi:nucleoside diphosphate-linked moiety X motif 19-like [Anneissia japonica]|uniref:nucleoside diphosphate-linked moiety X motif 19-like n=1 Tax=Anneissia japonica TaxID=1529436 RepID=UPI0014259D53|nr:nucleoside diphosphate-linked moiety X motif 19-like [Anneissia japonica]